MKCPKCNSSVVYVRITTRELVCRRCGTISPLPVEPVEKQEKNDKN